MLLAVVFAISGGVLLTDPAKAIATPVWSCDSSSTALRGGYNLTAPEAFLAKVPSLASRFIGSSFDLTGTVAAWRSDCFTNSNGNVSYGVADGKTSENVRTIPAGQDFAWVFFYAHYKDDRISRGANQMQSIRPRINAVDILALSPYPMANARCASVLGNAVDPFGGYGKTYWSSADLTYTPEAEQSMPSSRWSSVRGFQTISGKWDAASSSWRVKSRLWLNDGGTGHGYSKEATYTGSAVALGENFTVYHDGIYVEQSLESGTNKRQVVRKREAGYLAVNVEFVESVFTTDTAQAAIVYNKEVDASVLTGSPAGYNDGGTNDYSDADDTSILDGLGGLWSELLNKLAALLGPFGDVFRPVKMIDELGLGTVKEMEDW